MKRVLLLAAALFMVAGIAHAQEYCFTMEDLGGDEYYILMFVDGEPTDLAHINVWDSDTASEDTGEDPDEMGLYYTLVGGEDASGWHIEGPDEYGDNYWETEDPFLDFALAGGGGDNEDCMEPPEPEPPAVSARIVGPHNVDVGADVTLEVVTDGIDSPTYEWDDASTAATLALGVVDAGDTGVYGCTINGEADGEAIDPIEASFTLWVGVATPLAGGLGLGLLAGACALAGVIAIRRKK